jgi:hypothetical protein
MVVVILLLQVVKQCGARLNKRNSGAGHRIERLWGMPDLGGEERLPLAVELAWAFLEELENCRPNIVLRIQPR